MNRSSVFFHTSSRYISPFSTVRSVPGRMARWTSAALAVFVRRGSITTMRLVGRSIRRSTRPNVTGWASAALDPTNRNVSATSMSA